MREYGEGAYKKDIKTSYNQLGQILSIDDIGTSTYSRYQYDAAGNRLTESVIQIRNTHIEVLQDNHLSYDKLGRLSQVETGRYGLKYLYDNNGNRTIKPGSGLSLRHSWPDRRACRCLRHDAQQDNISQPARPHPEAVQTLPGRA